MTALNILYEEQKSQELKKEDIQKPEKIHHIPFLATLDLATDDIHQVMQQQKQQVQFLMTKLNILFVVNGALLSILTISRLIFIPSAFSFGEISEILINFTLLINAFLPRQEAVSPNLEDTKFLERYLNLPPEEYKLQMMVNLVQTYNTNKQRLDDVSQSLTYSAYVTWTIALTIMLHIVSAYFVQ
jgi:hypothetical protein